MIGVVDCDIEIYQQIGNWLPINHYMNNIYCSDMYWYKRIDYLFPNFPIFKEIKPYIFYQNIKRGEKVKDLITYTFTLNNEFIYQWLIQNYVDDYYEAFRNKRNVIRNLWHKNNHDMYVNQLLSLYLNHYELIHYINKIGIFACNIRHWIRCIKSNDIIVACIEKYNIKIDEV
jgi:hypothetical protein